MSLRRGSLIAAVLMGCLMFSWAAPRAAADERDDASPWGICTGAEWSGEYPRFNPMLAEAGVKWLRHFPEWQSIQQAPDQWDWERADAIVANAREHGIRISGTFAYLARFASADGGTRRFPIKDIDYFRRYAAACMNRYAETIRYWEVWNEFNGSFAPGGTPERYAELVQVAYDEARKLDRDIKVGMSVANFDVGFLDRAIEAGAADHFDFIAVHPYENLGMVMNSGGEAGFLSLAASLRDMLQAHDQPTDMPLWITEIGYQAPIDPDPARDRAQAEALLKAYLLAMASGFDKIFWFEARGPAYGHDTDHGIIRRDWSKRPAYTALDTMTRVLGPEPQYVGWLNIGDDGYGFVYDTGDGHVLATWAPRDRKVATTFDGAVNTVTYDNQRRALPAGRGLSVDDMPVFVTDLPAARVAQARANDRKPFPWGGDYANAQVVSCTLGVKNIEDGLRQTKLQTTAAVNDLTRSWRRLDFAHGGEGRYVYFRVDPRFVGYGVDRLKVTVVAKRKSPGDAANMNICYESKTGYHAVPGGHWTIPADDQWHEHTWELTGTNFVGQWGWNFRIEATGSPNEFFIRQVRVEK